MSLADDIRDLANRSLVSLDASHDYYAHTKATWRLLQEIVDEGRTFTLSNQMTGTVTDQQALMKRIEAYVADYLTVSSFQHFVALFEDFIFDLLRLWLMTYPASLSERPLKFGTVLKAPDKATVTQTVIDKELNDLKYERLADWFDYLEKLARLGCPSVAEIETLAEIKASRDILVHNKGMANAVYVAKAGNRARCQAGERLEIPEQYHHASWTTIKQVIHAVAQAAINKV
jgi:hypothetical protein